MSSVVKCVIVDDEQGAIDVLSSYIAKMPGLELVESYRDSLDALEYLKQHAVDLVFMDINMPDLSGLELTRLVQKPGLNIIFCTAYAEHAVESYALEARDYLLKPVAFRRFVEAVNKILPLDAQSSQLKVQAPALQRLFVKSGTQIFPMDAHEIDYLEKDGHYLVFHLGSREILSRMSIAEALKILPEEDFIQIHRSYIVALSSIELIQKQFITIGGRDLPLGDRYKQAFFARVPFSGS